MVKKDVIETHNLISETKFHLKSLLLIVRRQLQNPFNNINKFFKSDNLKNETIIAVSESKLWNTDDDAQNWILTAGKVQNLRLAALRLNGIEVPANKIFSFWRHIGNPNIGKGYVIGREIREGCVIPTIAGGLCQLSNALYDAALKAKFEIVERHKHTKVIKGSLAEQNRDATVKWNYIDFRFKSAYAFRIEVELTADQLILKLKSKQKHISDHAVKQELFESSKLNDCYSCGNLQCFKHPAADAVKKEKEITTFILDNKWPEFDAYIKTVSTDKDFFIIPLFKNRFIKTNRYNWSIKNPVNVRSTFWVTIKRAIVLRFATSSKRSVFPLTIQLDEQMARSAATLIPIESTHLVITQNLLPFIFKQGILGGRTFDVLMNRLPIEKLHQRLDYAYSKFPDSKTLKDFRAPSSLITWENIALTKARHIITPHTEIAEIFNNKSVKLSWMFPKLINKQTRTGSKILFPGAALGRKGAYEVKKLAKELNLCIVITHATAADIKFWEGVKTQIAGINTLDDICLIVYLTYVEQQPRWLLKILASGLPIITTAACGLDPNEQITIVPLGNYDILKQTVKQHLNKNFSLTA